MSPLASTQKISSQIAWGLRIWTATLLAGRAWQYAFWQTPYDSFPDLQLITLYLKPAICALFLVGVGLSLVSKTETENRWRDGVLVSISVCLLVHSILAAQQKHWYLSQLIEHGIQWVLPLLLAEALRPQPRKKVMEIFMRGGIALAFIGHGMYAANIFPTPAGFLEMTTRILPIGRDSASIVLKVAGIIDIGVGIAILFPHKHINRYALGYAIVWGFLTAIARVVAYVEWNSLGPDLFRWGWETLHRLGHGGLPLVLWGWISSHSLNAGVSYEEIPTQNTQ